MERALVWYERLFGRPADGRPTPELAEWRLARGGGVQLVFDPVRAGRTAVTLAVEDMDALAADLAERGVEPRPGPPGAGHHRQAHLTDLDGNVITFAEDPRAAVFDRSAAARAHDDGVAILGGRN